MCPGIHPPFEDFGALVGAYLFRIFYEIHSLNNFDKLFNFGIYKYNGICTENPYINKMVAGTHQRTDDAVKMLRLLVKILKPLIV
jgi:hypothetical protein